MHSIKPENGCLKTTSTCSVFILFFIKLVAKGRLETKLQQISYVGTSLQSTAGDGDMGLTPGQGTKILRTMWHSHKKRKGKKIAMSL